MLAEFKGERLRQARLARGCTATALAEEIGISPARISHYERDRSRPSDEVVNGLSDALGVPVRFFFTARKTFGAGPRRWRSQSAATKRARLSVEQHLDWLTEILRAVDEYIDRPMLDLPVRYLGAPELLDQDEIEEHAANLRHAWGLGEAPISNLIHLIESKGFVVSRFSFGACLDGVSVPGSEPALIAINSDRCNCVRSRYDVAHELGHWVLHQNAPEKPDSALFKLMEKQAHAWAGALLFPARPFVDEVYGLTPESLLAVKGRWKMSMAAMVMRAGALGVATSSQIQRAFRTLSARGYRKREPLDDQLEVEHPVLLKKAIELLLTEGLTTDRLLHSVPLQARKIEVLAGLQPGTLTGVATPTETPDVQVRPNLLQFQRK